VPCVLSFRQVVTRDLCEIAVLCVWFNGVCRGAWREIVNFFLICDCDRDRASYAKFLCLVFGWGNL